MIVMVTVMIAVMMMVVVALALMVKLICFVTTKPQISLV